MSACSATDFYLVVKYRVTVITKHHISGAIDDPISGVCGTIIEDLIDCFVCVLGSEGLFGANGTKAEK